MRTGSGWAVVLCFVIAESAWGATAWNESSSGDLSNNQLAPTPITLTNGINSLIGNLSAGDSQDWVAVTVPPGRVLSQYLQVAYSQTDVSFTGFHSGATFTGNAGDAGSYAGYTHFGATFASGTDLLPLMNGAPGSSGFTIPLAAGSYTFLLQQASGIPTGYQVDFNVVPESATFGFLASAVLLSWGRRRRGAR